MSMFGGMPPGSTFIGPNGQMYFIPEEKKDDKKKKPSRRKKKKDKKPKYKNPFTFRETMFLMTFFSIPIGAIMSNVFLYTATMYGMLLTHTTENLRQLLTP